MAQEKAKAPTALSIYPDREVRDEIANFASEEDRPVAKMAVVLIKEAIAARKAKNAQ
jgi:hypothetical protein